MTDETEQPTDQVEAPDLSDQPQAESSPADVVTLIQKNIALGEKLIALFEEKIAYDSAKEKAFDKIYDELQQYKDNFLFLSQKPIFLDLILLLDNIEKMKSSLTPEDQDCKNLFDRISDEILEILYRRDIVPFDEKYAFYQKGLHKVVKTIPTPVEAENNQIVEIVRRGYQWGERILRAEEVVVKKFNSEPAPDCH